ncbi:hypothetical protein BDZ94DRAFT_1317874 [Collybia nuda]|uniref:Mid2 domain-containing protein n=1 Tax=Collybia nuda TaxID=64659 RepID=A0A9P5YJ01_9AGAR|nr:hypothetical protein BDZ94DRAFT_1317874 [Collybia nuda]
MPCMRNLTAFLTSLLFPSLVHSTIFLTVDGNATLDVYKPISWTRSLADPETFLLVNVVLTTDATHGTQELLRTNGTTSGTSQVVAHFPGTHHVFAFLDSTSVTADAIPLATSNDFEVNPAPTSSTSTGLIATITTNSSVPATIVTVTASSPIKAASHLNTPALAGGIVGAAVVVLLIIAAIWYFLRGRRKVTVTIDNTAVSNPFTLQSPPNHPPMAPHQMAPFGFEKHGAQPPPMIGTQNMFESVSHQPLATSSRSQNSESMFTSAIATEVNHHRILPKPGGIVHSPTTEADRMAIKLDEAVAEIANIRGELQSLKDSGQTLDPTSDISPPTYEYSYINHQ